LRTGEGADIAANRQLSRFVRDALADGRPREEIRAALGQAGWSPAEVTEALDAWAETAFSPPIPRPQATVSARDFFVYALIFGLLLGGAIHLIQLFHALIDMALEDEPQRSSYTIRWAMAVLIVTVPLYLWLTWREGARLAADAGRYRSAIRKWLIYITLLVAATTLICDLVAVIYAFLNGDATGQFFAKAAVVGAVAGAVFLYYRHDLRRGDAA
jgi:hypothetical protein